STLTSMMASPATTGTALPGGIRETDVAPVLLAGMPTGLATGDATGEAPGDSVRIGNASLTGVPLASKNWTTGLPSGNVMRTPTRSPVGDASYPRIETSSGMATVSSTAAPPEKPSATMRSPDSVYSVDGAPRVRRSVSGVAWSGRPVAALVGPFGGSPGGPCAAER